MSRCTASNTQGLGTATPKVVMSLNFSTPTVHRDRGTATQSAVRPLGSALDGAKVRSLAPNSLNAETSRERFVPHWQPGRKCT
jgi:hypothetical protein